ncbi:sodium/proline symporter PutP [Butyricicoccus sp.]|uniref:sodium/proline symporter PutP n=1 Tax=Butyricicoccus sp. TaxID=2049021 RepID=UPI003735196F
MSSTICIVIAIVLYLAMMLYVGYACSKRNSNVDDFYLGGRKLGPFVTAMSAEASDMSSWLLMGLPGVAYATGIADAAWTAIGLAIGTYLNWLIVARRIRVYSHTTGSITLPDFFSNRYGDKKHLLSSVAAVIIIIFFIPYTASGFAACGKLFNSLFGVDYILAMLVSAAIIVGYCALGGFLAASTTDLIQSIVMTIALFIVICFGIVSAGGWDAVLDNARALPGYLSLTEIHDPASSTSSSYSPLTIASTLAWGLGYFGMPHVLLRFMATEDEDKLKTSRRIATIWVVISMAVAVLIGIVGLAMSNAGILPALEDSETVIINIAHVISQYGIIPALIAGVILSGILASTMSTADSQLLAAASSVSQNIIQDLFGVQMSEKKSMRTARVTVVLIAIVAVFLARDPNSSVFKIVSFAWAGFGATFGPVVLLALFWKRSNKWGALAGMVAGGVMVFVWKFGIATLGGVFAIYELLPAFVIACIVNVVVSLLTPAPSREVTDIFDAVTAKM